MTYHYVPVLLCMWRYKLCSWLLGTHMHVCVCVCVRETDKDKGPWNDNAAAPTDVIPDKSHRPASPPLNVFLLLFRSKEKRKREVQSPFKKNSCPISSLLLSVPVPVLKSVAAVCSGRR